MAIVFFVIATSDRTFDRTTVSIPTEESPHETAVVNTRTTHVPQTPPKDEQDEPLFRFHIVQPGETLSRIAEHYYDSAAKWKLIFEANRDVIKDSKNLRPGTKIVIPEDN
jgi:nucleoid-associated protein YgaU